MMRSLLLTLAPAAALAYVPSQYAPEYVTCPSETLVRSADGISSSEDAYSASRKANADVALKSWLGKNLPLVDSSSLPTIALATSGGSFRSFLVGAGVIQAFDDRDSDSKVAGLYQAFTYQAALSGGGWLLSSLAAANWPTVSYLRDTVWETQLSGGILDSSLDTTVADFTQIVVDIDTKGARGFPVSLTDPWGRMLSYQMMAGGTGAMNVTISDLTTFSNFTSHKVPFPIITGTQINKTSGECEPSPEEALYEFNPYEFGSWSDDISAFVKSEYLGSTINGGVATACANGFDNIDYVLGTTSQLLNTYICEGIDIVDAYFPAAVLNAVEQYTNESAYGYSLIPNPFYNYNSTTATQPSSVASDEILYVVDGGESTNEHNVPILPLLEPSRNISVLVINDNSNDINGWPSGISLVAAYNMSQASPRLAGRFPVVPAEGEFSAQKAQFFGCDDAEAVTVVYLPNADWTYASNTSTTQLQYSSTETMAMIGNGNEIASQGDNATWASCLACGLMLKEVGGVAHLPPKCVPCLAEYCWSG